MENKMETGVSITTVDITPSDSVELDGYHRESPSIGIKDNLLASILIIKNKATKNVLITLDSIGITVALSDRIRCKASEYLKIEKENIMLCCTHTHSSPKTLDENYSPNAYSYFLEEKIFQGIIEADKSCYPCRVGYGVSSCEIALNRREKNEYGKAIMGEDPFGVVDGRVGIVKFIDETNEIIAILLRVSAHGNVLKGDNLYISADYFGRARLKIEEKYNCKVIMINGAAGNLNAKFRGTDEALDKMAEEILKCVDLAIEDIETKEVAVTSMKSLIIDGKTKDLPSIENAEALSNLVSLKWEVDTTRWLQSITKAIVEGKGNINVKFELQKFQIDDFVICGCPMEVFSETALEISKNLGELVFLNGYTNGNLMYLPSKKELSCGGYEVEWAPVVYGPMVGILMPFSEDTEAKLIDGASKLVTEVI